MSKNLQLEEEFVKIFNSSSEISKAKYIGLRNQGRTKLYSITRVKCKFRFKIRDIVELSLYYYNLSMVPSVTGKIFALFLEYVNKSCAIFQRIIGAAIERSLTNKDLLVAQGVHPNPGPVEYRKDFESVQIITYNCRGLRNVNKLKRLLVKSSKHVSKGAIVALQETHKIEEKFLNDNWCHKYVINASAGDQRGVLILFNKKYELLTQYMDDTDRILIINIKSENHNLIVANIYCPNNHRDSIKVIENVYQHLLKFKYDSPESFVLLVGDFNMCMSNRDYINRNTSKQEQIVVTNVDENNKMLKLSDSFRILNPEGGYTWNRGSCFSRLDYIFVSDNILRYVDTCVTDWAFDQSDHAAVILDLNIPICNTFGPGITRVNTKVLENKVSLSQIKENLSEYLNQAPANWNPNVKLEFFKVGIRTTFSEAAKLLNSDKKHLSDMIEGELNHLVNIKIKVAGNLLMSQEVKLKRLETIDLAIRQIQVKQSLEATEYSEDLAKKARVKWYELGEKSNKYFLGLLKLRQKQKFIGEIICEGSKYIGQNQIIIGIRDFYRNLYNNADSLDEYVGNDSFYEHCPKLSKEQREYIDSPLTIGELSKALKSCKDSAPGPDGIPYSVYKSLWDIAAPIILDSWKYSVKEGLLPRSHLESVITLLPKEGKDTKDIKNWRPITLANCDSKIITKALANRLAGILESIIDKSQTAYIPGRSVMDNIRSNFLIRSHCRRKNIESLLISLDARKAFDSVSHRYICRTLKEYGFGPQFVSYFKTLYNNLSANVLVNGFKSDSINIKRGVKQGDALSCALFIICIDPLLRNVNNNRKIRGVEIYTKSGGKIEYKINGYADDIAVISTLDKESVRQIFKEYERLSLRSGLVLNADKTEIINLNPISNLYSEVKFEYMDSEYIVPILDKLKICGVYYANNNTDEYNLNVMDKIGKLKNQLKKWMVRHLTLEGKVLIVKTFGLSQLIYNMQCYEVRQTELTLIERLIFKFLWSKVWEDDKRCTERIKRAILKNDYIHGGVKAPDVESLDRALKLKQFIRGGTTTHPVSHLQKSALERLNYDSLIHQEYSRVCKDDAIIKVGQDTINILTDYCRLKEYGGLEKSLSSKNAISTL